MPTRTPKNLYHGLPNTTTFDLYTVPTSTKTDITSIVVGNIGSTAKYFTLHHVPSGGSVSDSNIIGGKMKKLVGTSDINGAGEYVFEVPFRMATGDKLTIVLETASTMNVKITGIEEV